MKPRNILILMWLFTATVLGVAAATCLHIVLKPAVPHKLPEKRVNEILLWNAKHPEWVKRHALHMYDLACPVAPVPLLPSDFTAMLEEPVETVDVTATGLLEPQPVDVPTPQLSQFLENWQSTPQTYYASAYTPPVLPVAYPVPEPMPVELVMLGGVVFVGTMLTIPRRK